MKGAGLEHSSHSTAPTAQPRQPNTAVCTAASQQQGIPKRASNSSQNSKHLLSSGGATWHRPQQPVEQLSLSHHRFQPRQCSWGRMHLSRSGAPHWSSRSQTTCLQEGCAGRVYVLHSEGNLGGGQHTTQQRWQERYLLLSPLWLWSFKNLNPPTMPKEM